MNRPLASADENAVAITPRGYRYALILAALTKRVLLAKDLKPHDRLELLERLDRVTDRSFSPAVIAVIEPASDVESAIVHEAHSLDPPNNQRCGASFDVLTSQRVFCNFLMLNPSLLAAVKMMTARPREIATYGADDPAAPQTAMFQPADPDWVAQLKVPRARA